MSPLRDWILLLLSAGLGLGLEVAFLRAQKRHAVARHDRDYRAGASGHAISFACEDSVFNLPAIEDFIEHSLPVSKYDSDALLTDLPRPKPRPRRHQPNGNRGRNNRSAGGNGRASWICLARGW